MKIQNFKVTLRDEKLDMSEFVEDGEDSTLNVTFNTSALTPAMQMRMQENPEDVRIVVENMVDLLAKWDLKDGGKVVPITVEALAVLPMFFLGAIFEKISESIGGEEDASGKA